jgi:hypothetical protein
MAGTVEIFGHAVKKPVVYAGAGVAVIGGVLIVREMRSRSAASAAAPADTSSTDTTGDTSDSSLYGDDTGDDMLGSDGYGLYDPNSQQYIYPGTSPIASPTISTNAEWTQEVISYFSGLGDTGSYSSAIGVAEAGRCLTAGQLQLVDNAIAAMGTPPQAWPVAPFECGGATGGSPVPKTTQGTVPNVVGKVSETAEVAILGAGFKVKWSTTRKGGVVYDVTAQSPRAGAKATKGSTVTLSIKAKAKGK